MISEDEWIELPVGYNLNDHVGVSNFPLYRPGVQARKLVAGYRTWYSCVNVIPDQLVLLLT